MNFLIGPGACLAMAPWSLWNFPCQQLSGVGVFLEKTELEPTGGSCWRSSFWCWLPGRRLDDFMRFQLCCISMLETCQFLTLLLACSDANSGAQGGHTKFLPTDFWVGYTYSLRSVNEDWRLERGQNALKWAKGCKRLCDNHWIGHKLPAIHRSCRDVEWTNLGGDACHVEDLREVHLHWYRGLLKIWQHEFLVNSVNVCIFYDLLYVTFDTSMHLKLVALRNLARQENCPKPQRSNSEPTLSTLKDKLSQSFENHFHRHSGLQKCFTCQIA